MELHNYIKVLDNLDDNRYSMVLYDAMSYKFLALNIDKKDENLDKICYLLGIPLYCEIYEDALLNFAVEDFAFITKEEFYDMKEGA